MTLGKEIAISREIDAETEEQKKQHAAKRIENKLRKMLSDRAYLTMEDITNTWQS